MTKEDIIRLIKHKLLEILPDLEDQEIDIHKSLKEFGANSIDRAELLSMTLEDLDQYIPVMHFAAAKSIEDMARIMHARVDK